ncbi:MAG: hypothetical protein COA38_20430 [Fluviicola sp.]|nr:MAG: hypothetical protein COA38_20430 [Fluviicola sp.]
MSDIGPMEAAYDEHVAPLMTKIIAACEVAGIPMLATFFLDDTSQDHTVTCTTLKTPAPDHADGSQHRSTKRLLACAAIIRPRPALFSFATIMGGES